MRKLTFILSLVFVFVSCNGKAQNNLKRYNLKSGIVEYQTSISGKVMGSTISGTGVQKLFFKDWGAVELKEEESSKTTTIQFFGKGKTETSSTHTLVKIENGESYSVDFENKTITGSRDMTMEMLKENDMSAEEAGKNMLEAMGGKKIGNETYKGYNCELWTFAGGKQWTYKGVMLKMEMTVLGIKTLTEATSIKFDISVPDSKFKLPDFPIHKTESLMNSEELNNEMNSNEVQEGMKEMQKLSFDEWKKMVKEGDPEMKNTSDEELRQSYDLMQKMLKMRQGN